MPQELFTVSGQPNVKQFFHVGGDVANSFSLFTVIVLQEAEHRQLALRWSDQHVFIADGGGDFHVPGWTSQTTYLDTQL